MADECNFIYSLVPTNIRGYVHRFHITNERTRAWDRSPGLTHDPFIRTNMWGPGAGSWPTCGPYVRRLTDEYSPPIRRLTYEFSNFVFLLLLILATSQDGEPKKQAIFNTIPVYPAQFNKMHHNPWQFKLKLATFFQNFSEVTQTRYK
jgi:hypothetical protein